MRLVPSLSVPEYDDLRGSHRQYFRWSRLMGGFRTHVDHTSDVGSHSSTET